MADPVRPLVLIAGVEALAGLAVFVAVVVAVLGGGAEGLSGGGTGLVVAEVVVWLLFVGGLGLVWFGLYRRRLLARTPFLLVQAFVLVLVPLFWGSDPVAHPLARPAPQSIGSAIVVRIWASDFASSRDTCICEMPTRSAIWACVMFS
jgi:hypothetical protein